MSPSSSALLCIDQPRWTRHSSMLHRTTHDSWLLVANIAFWPLRQLLICYRQKTRASVDLCINQKCVIKYSICTFYHFPQPSLLTVSWWDNSLCSSLGNETGRLLCPLFQTPKSLKSYYAVHVILVYYIFEIPVFLCNFPHAIQRKVIIYNVDREAGLAQGIRGTFFEHPLLVYNLSGLRPLGKHYQCYSGTVWCAVQSTPSSLLLLDTHPVGSLSFEGGTLDTQHHFSAPIAYNLICYTSFATTTYQHRMCV